MPRRIEDSWELLFALILLLQYVVLVEVYEANTEALRVYQFLRVLSSGMDLTAKVPVSLWDKAWEEGANRPQ